MNGFDLKNMLRDEDYSFSMKMVGFDPQSFFAPTDSNAEILSERRHWLAADPGKYVAASWAPGRCLSPLMDLALKSGAALDPSFISEMSVVPQVRRLGELWEPDFLLVSPGSDGGFILRAGCVCFPSSWALEEKLGERLESIHGVVPGLNATIGERINRFLQQMKTGSGWLRANWGISSVSDRNQHPSRGVRRLTADTDPTSTWLRIEHQLLTRLDADGLILFGIRLENIRMTDVRADGTFRTGLRRALATMPEAMLRYKNLVHVREGLLDYLD